jgi:hypothetical protein
VYSRIKIKSSSRVNFWAYYVSTNQSTFTKFWNLKTFLIRFGTVRLKWKTGLTPDEGPSLETSKFSLHDIFQVVASLPMEACSFYWHFLHWHRQFKEIMFYLRSIESTVSWVNCPFLTKFIQSGSKFLEITKRRMKKIIALTRQYSVDSGTQ